MRNVKRKAAILALATALALAAVLAWWLRGRRQSVPRSTTWPQAAAHAQGCQGAQLRRGRGSVGVPNSIPIARYPAACSFDNLLTVGAVDKGGKYLSAFRPKPQMFRGTSC